MFNTLRSKILVSYLVVILLMGVLTAWSVASLISIERHGREDLTRHMRVLKLVDTLEFSLSAVKTTSLRLVYDPLDSLDRQWYERSSGELNGHLRRLEREVESIGLFDESDRVSQMNYLANVLLSEINSLVSPSQLTVTRSVGARAESYTGEIEPLFDSVRSYFQVVGHDYLNALDKRSGHIVEESRGVQLNVIALGSVALVICAYLSFRFARMIVAPIAELTEKSRLITAGELHQMVVPRTGDELGKLGEQFNLMAEKLTEFEELNLKKILEEKAISESIVQAMDDGLILIDRLGYILSVNRRAEELFGFRTVEGQRCSEVSRGIPVLESLCFAAINNTWHPELSAKIMEHQVDGQTIYVTRDIIPIQSGEWLGTVAYLLILRDVSRAYELEKMRSDFVGMVSHELRTPLTSIRMSVDLLAEPTLGKLSDVQEQFVQAIREESERLLRIVNDLMDLAKIESGKFEVKPIPVNLQEFLDHLLVPFIAPAKESGIQLTVERDPALEVVHADPDRLKQVFVNLISNAMRYTPRGGTISYGVRHRSTRNVAEFFVKDTGAGIPREFLPKIFQRFAIESSDAKAGTGLGLAIAKEIVQAHGGAISVKSEINQGTEFVFTIPLALNVQTSTPTYTTSGS